MWNASKHLLGSRTFFVPKENELNPALHEDVLWVQKTSDWTTNFVQSLGISIQERENFETLFPEKLGGKFSKKLTLIAFPEHITRIIENVPSAQSAGEYMWHYQARREVLNQEPKIVMLFAKRLYEACVNQMSTSPRESFVDALVGLLLTACDFDVDPLSFRFYLFSFSHFAQKSALFLL